MDIDVKLGLQGKLEKASLSLYYVFYFIVKLGLHIDVKGGYPLPFVSHYLINFAFYEEKKLCLGWSHICLV